MSLGPPEAVKRPGIMRKLDPEPGWEALWIPGHMPDLNELLTAKATVYNSKSHKRQNRYGTLKSTWCGKIAMLAHLQLQKKYERAEIRYVFYEDNKKRDPSNFSFGAIKFIEDALVDANIIPGDGWKNIAKFTIEWHVGKPSGIAVFIRERPVHDDQWREDRVARAKEADGHRPRAERSEDLREAITEAPPSQASGGG